MVNVLIVEDDPISAKLLESVIHARYACDIVHAENGAVALKVIADLDYDVAVVLTDIVMPEMNGMALVYELHQLELIDCLVVIGMSSLLPDDLMAIQTGLADVSWFDSWIAKPFDCEEVFEILNDYLPVKLKDMSKEC